MDRETLAAYDADAGAFARDWHGQPPPSDLHRIVKRYFRPGSAADVGCGSGREVAFLTAEGYQAVGYDASEALLAQARRRYPLLTLERAVLPDLVQVADATFDNVLCETVIMHLPRDQIAPAVRRLCSLLKPRGVLYLSWRVTTGADRRDGGRLYTAFGADLVRAALIGGELLLDEEALSASSGRLIHRLIARKGD